MASLWDDLESLVDSPSSFSAQSGDRGTIKPKGNFSAADDAAAIKKAIDGFGTNEKVLIDILTQRSNAQRQLICKAYQEATGRTLDKDLKGDTHGHFENLLVALITPPAAYDCHEVMRAMKVRFLSGKLPLCVVMFLITLTSRIITLVFFLLLLFVFICCFLSCWILCFVLCCFVFCVLLQGAGTKESILTEIFASRSNQQIKALQSEYLQETKKELSLKLKRELPGNVSKALLLLAEGNRDESTNVDKEKAKLDAEALYAAGEKKWGTDESKFIEVLCRRSIAQLRQTLVEYKNLSGKTLQQSIEGEMSGELEELLVAVAKCVKSVPAYFAERLHESMKGGGTDESTLIRIMVSRSEIDLLDIRAEFKKLYNHSLLSELESELSGELGECLKAICGGDD